MDLQIDPATFLDQHDLPDLMPTAFQIVAADDEWCEASVYLNGHSLLPTDCPDLDLLKLVARHPPIREQLEAVRDMIVEALAA